MFTASGYADPASNSREMSLAEIRQFHDSLLTLDSHVDIPENFATDVVDPARRDRQQVDLVKMKEGGLDAAFFIVYVGQNYRNDWEYKAAHDAALNKFRAIHRMVQQNSETIGFAQSVADVRALYDQKKKIALIGIENGFVIGKDIGRLKEYYDLGARYMTLTHMGHNDIADSSDPKARFSDQRSEHGGLSDFGRSVIMEMNRLGIMVDVSHTAKETVMEAVALSAAPVIASHSGVASVRSHSRNLDDEQLRAIAAKGGVIQVTAVDEFLLDQPSEMWREIFALRREMGILDLEYMAIIDPEIVAEYQKRLEAEILPKWRRVTLDDFLDHVDHAVKIAGIDHVGIASDFDGGGGVLGWDHAGESLNVTKGLLRRGYSRAAIQKLWGENLLRVMGHVETVARESGIAE
ncbi:dipeptidase [Kordiimonas sediminis]|uniref:Dipeptidase n=2 Tax=Kordiimonas sediminis TaxID=1735581 RepID=A0A919E5M3_9PROT|nr:dipeptidase [Kordiimonas sediminis]